MGNKVITFTDEQLDDYQDCTFFTRKEILNIFKRYRELDPKLVPQTMTGDEAHTFALPMDRFEKMPELKGVEGLSLIDLIDLLLSSQENPFRARICKVFSHDNSGNMTFDDFLDMLSVFSESAPRDVKVYYAFKIYDYDEDRFITGKDIEQTCIALTKSELSPEEIAVVREKVLEETDNDRDDRISFAEFQHVIARAPDFLSTFHVRI